MRTHALWGHIDGMDYRQRGARCHHLQMANHRDPVQRVGDSSGLSISYNVGAVLFGGLTPVAVTWLLATLGTPLAPAFWLVALAGLSLVCVLASNRYVHTTSQISPASRHEKV
ncbi:hypothetical protein JYK22_35465, partial [Nonomuraea sp. RK-328]|nr:hypothetical protein [Nonomuraea sp. RK-328]